MAKARKSLTKKTRFEVFKRDAFTCQYCGKKAPDVVLNVDHIDPVSKGGANEIINLITSCVDCNSGKSDRTLDDQSTLSKQREQLIELSERREQLELMLKWRAGLKEIGDMTLEVARDHFKDTFQGFNLASDRAINKLRKLIREFGLQPVMDAMETASETYCCGNFTADTVNLAWAKVGGICHNVKNPSERDIRYVRGILRNRLSYVHEGIALSLLRRAVASGADIESLKELAFDVGSWRAWQMDMEDMIDSMGSH